MVHAPRYAFGDVELDTGRVLLLKGGRAGHPRAEGVRRPAAARRARAAGRRQGGDLRGRLEGHRRHRQRADADRRAAAPGARRRRARSALHRDGVGARVSPAAGRAATRCAGTAGGDERRGTGRLRPTRGRRHAGATANRRWHRRRRRGARADLDRRRLRRRCGARRRRPCAAAAATVAANSLGNLDLAVAASLGPEQLTAATGYDGYVAYLARRRHDRLQLRPIGRASRSTWRASRKARCRRRSRAAPATRPSSRRGRPTAA